MREDWRKESEEHVQLIDKKFEKKFKIKELDMLRATFFSYKQYDKM